MDSVDNLANLRVASFSYYLKSNDQENFVQKLNIPEQNPIPDDNTAFSLTKSSPYSINYSKSIECPENVVKVKQLSAFLNDPQESFMFKVQRPSMDARSQSGQPGSRPNERIKQSMDGEIDIFSADKYFNMKLECPAPAKMNKPETKRDDRTVDVNPFVKKQEAQSVCSEASTWSSGVALLQNFPGNNSQKKARKFTGRRFFSTIGCTGPCFDKESVYVRQNSKCQIINQSGLIKTRLDNFTFPLVDHVVEPNNPKLNFKNFEDQTTEDFRKSIEVFGGSDIMKKDDITKNLEIRLSMLTWDAIPKSTTSNIPTTSVVTTTTPCDDMASDVSSDLFEIENISATCGGGYMMTRESVDDVSSCMTPTTQYAPSEASFEWSVMTASAADFSSAVSDYDLKHVGALGNEGPMKVKNLIPSNKEAPKNRPGGGLLGCTSLKSLSVAETIHKTKVERY